MSFRSHGTFSGGANIPVGTQLNLTYEIDRFIAGGGMGEVYAGHTIETGDPVAIKVVLPEFAADKLMLDLFKKEARVLFHLAHDAIVRYYAFATDPSLGRSYLAMEFVDGPSLTERIRSGPIAVEEVVGLKSRLADGLQKAHDAGIVHRDISPDNVILQGGHVSRAKLIDFGIAKSATVGGEGTLIGDAFAGRYNFASPEQLGMFSRKVTAQSDIYSLALVLAAALRGSPIDMGGAQVDVIDKRRVIPDLSDVAPEMHELLESMLQPDTADRLPTMADVRDWHIETAADLERTVVPSVSFERSSGSRRPGFTGSKQPGISGSKKPPKSGSQRPGPSGSQRPGSSRPSLSPRPSAAPRLDLTPKAKPRKSRTGMWIAMAAIVAIGAGGAGGWYYVESLTANWDQTATPVAETQPPAEPAGETKPPDENLANVPAPDIADAPPAASDSDVESPGTGEVETAALGVGGAIEIADYIRNYEGGDCFFASPVEVGDRVARIAGYAAALAPFEKFQADFQASAGFEPEIMARIVRMEQCSVVKALSVLARSKTPKPNLSIRNQNLANGEAVSGTVSDLPNRTLELLNIDQDGKTFRLTEFLDKKGEFGVRVSQKKKVAAQESVPQLIVVVSSPAPLQSLVGLDKSRPVLASALFPTLQAEAERVGEVSIAVGYFRLELGGQ